MKNIVHDITGIINGIAYVKNPPIIPQPYKEQLKRFAKEYQEANRQFFDEGKTDLIEKLLKEFE